MCKCIELANQKLAPDNTRIEDIFVITSSLRQALGIRTVKISSSRRGKPKTVLASFCPFCGEDLRLGKTEKQS
jgi:hypothetical protein